MREYNAERIEIIARMIEQSASTLENTAVSLRRNAEALRKSRNFDHAGYAINKLAYLGGAANLDGIHNAVVNAIECEK